MAGLTPIVKMVPGFNKADMTTIESTYGCDGEAGTFGWQPVRIVAGFRWAGSSQTLVALLNRRLGARGWARGIAPGWAGTTDTIDTTTWTYPQGRVPGRAFALDPAQGKAWTVELVAKPKGRLASPCQTQ